MKVSVNLFRRIRKEFVLYPVALLLIIGLYTEVNGDAFTNELDEYLTASHEVWKFHGAALVAKDGKVLFKKGYGMASLELGVPSAPQMKYLIGSITKQFTAVAILQLEEKGRLSLEDPITKFLPDYPKETGDRVTIHHLLRHTSGVPSYTDNPEAMGLRTTPTTLEALIALFEDLPLDFEPGEKYEYSNSGYVLLGAVIEAVSGMTYEEYIKANIFDVVGMTNSGYAHHDLIIPNRAAGYNESEDDELQNAYVVHMSWPYAAGGLYSTVEDMLLWDQALYSEKLLSKSSLERMFTPGKGDYGYGWVIRDFFGHKLVWHNGGIDGFYTSFMRFLEDKVCVVVFSNNESAPVDEIARGVSAVMLGEPYDLPVIKNPIEVDPQLLADYVGVYQIDSADYRIISIDDGQLRSLRTGGQQRTILPEAGDKFYFDYNHIITLRFVRDENGEVTSHIIHQGGQDEPPAVRLPDDEAAKVLAAYEPVEVDPAVYDDYVGQYELMPEFILTITRREDRLFLQATGQDEAEMFPRSESEFFLKVVDASLDFVRDESGKVTGLILHQSGRDMPASRIE